MEKRHLVNVIFFVFFIGGIISADSPSQIRKIHFPLWAELDAYPELEEAQNLSAGVYDYPISRIRKTAPFLIEGMVYGWEFSYTPQDKMRGVEENLEITEIVPSDVFLSHITFSSVWFENERMNCWVTFERNESQIQNYNLWASIKNPVIHGRGYGKLIDGFDGIKNAAAEALKNAVREHFRAIIKNKPKQIKGKVLIKELPVLGIDAGKYVINLDFFLECDKIVEYKVF
ncbi:MAG: hypothetical protein SPE03_13585 [Treponema sp.]|nr:hypothetical protein [Treponema sp.]